MSQTMGRNAKIFAYSVIAAGSAVFLLSLARWDQADPAEFWTLLILGAVASQVKVRFPGFAGTFTASLFISFICLLELSLGEAAVVAVASSAVQTFWKARTRPSALKLLFNLGILSITVCGSADVYRMLGMHAAWLGTPVLLASLAGVYFFLNTAPIALIVSLTSVGARNAMRGWLDAYGSTCPFYFAGAALGGIMHHAARSYGWQVTFLALPLLFLVERSYSTFFGRLEDSKRHLEEMSALQMRSIRTLALAVEAKDDTTHTHLHRVQTYAMEIGRELGLSQEELLALQAASILHDVGKLAVPEHIISKPGKLTSEEFEKMKIHTVVGAEIVEGMEFPYPVAPIVRAHHEKWNGMGYPYGLKEETIPIGARILSAVDCLDALATDRQYRRALPLDKAMEMVKADAGKAFDPKVVEVLVKRYRELEALAHSTLAAVKVQTFSVNDRVELGASPDAGLEVSSRISDRGKFLAGASRIRANMQSVLDSMKHVPGTVLWDYFAHALSGELRETVSHHALAVFRRAGDKVVTLGVAGDDADLLRGLEIPEGQGLAGWVAGNRKAILNANPSVEPTNWRRPLSLRGALAVPIGDRDAVRGVVVLYHRSSDSFSQDHLDILEMLAPLVLKALDTRHEKEVQRPSVAEGCVTAEEFLSRIDAGAAGAKFALARIDLEGEYKRGAALDLIRRAFRAEDLVAQFGPNEFVLLCYGLDATAMDLRLAALREFAGGALRLYCGVAAAESPVESAERIIGRAERELYEDRRRSALTPATGPTTDSLLGLSRAIGQSVALTPELWKA